MREDGVREEVGWEGREKLVGRRKELRVGGNARQETRRDN